MKLIFIFILFPAIIFSQSKDSGKVIVIQEIKVPDKPYVFQYEIDEKKINSSDLYPKYNSDDFYEMFMLMNIYTEQRKTNRLIINGEKKWIQF